MTKLRWRVKLVAERQPGVVTETELACIERDEQISLAGACNLVVGDAVGAGCWLTR